MFVLASESPRRRRLLELLGLRFEVRPADIDESVRPGEDPVAYVRRLARAKADAVIAAGSPGARPAGMAGGTVRRDDTDRPHRVVLAADTTVELHGEILGKPRDGTEAASMLRRLSGRAHRVHTGVAVNRDVFAVSTEVRFVELSDAAIDWYVATGEPSDKAGAYAIQGAGGAFVASITGSFSNVVGLPLAETLAALRAAGVDDVPG